MPTVLSWSNLKLVNSSASGTVLRQGNSLVRSRRRVPGQDMVQNNDSPIGHEQLRSYSFFNPSVGTVFAGIKIGCQDPASNNLSVSAGLAQYITVPERQAFMQHAAHQEPSAISLGEQCNISHYRFVSARVSRAYQADLQSHRLQVRALYEQLMTKSGRHRATLISR